MGSFNSLFHAIKNQIIRDNNEFKHTLLRTYLNQNKVRKITYDLVDNFLVLKFSAYLSLMIISYFSIKLDFRKNIFLFPTLKNELKSIRSIRDTLKEIPYQLITKSFTNITLTFPLLKIFKSFRIFFYLEKKIPTFSLLRVAQLIGFYSRLQSQLPRDFKNKNKLSIVTTESNPNGFALIAFSNRNSIPLIFMSHGEPIAPTIKHNLDLIILPGMNSRDFYKNSNISKTLFYGHKQDYLPIQLIKENRKLLFGIFLSKSINEQGLEDIIKYLENQGHKYFFRYHPNYQENNKNLKEHIDQADIILAGNTNVHLEVILNGKLSLYCQEIDSGPQDLNNYVNQGLVLQWYKEIPINLLNRHIKHLNSSKLIGRFLDLELSYKDSLKKLELEINQLISS